MENLNKYKSHKVNLNLLNDEYFDIVISNDISESKEINNLLVDDSLSTYIDFANKKYTKSGRTIYSSNEYSWKDAVNSGVTLENIGYTGIDNGLINYNGWDKISNRDFLKKFIDTELSIESGITNLSLNFVTGNTLLHSYNFKLEENYLKLMGGFLQGFYKLDGNKYQVLPNKIDKEWNIEITLRPQNYNINNKSLNSLYPNNSGIFFYMGTRAEDKFIQMYNCDLSKYEDREQPETPSYCDKFLDGYFAEEVPNYAEKGIELYNMIQEYANECLTSGYSEGADISLSGLTFLTSDGQPLNDSGYYEIETDNKFLTFNRTKYGFTTATWDDDYQIILTGSTNDVHRQNLYPVMHRGVSGYTVDTLENYYLSKKDEEHYNFIPDIQNNAFALKYYSDGSVGYRYLVKDCENEDKYSILEEKSYQNIIKFGEWNTINAKIKKENSKEIKIYIYVNGMLKFVSKTLPIFNFCRLNTLSQKQETVPYNISVGGGTQGLCDSVWVDYEHTFEKILPIEKNFAGTFIGDIKSFKFYTDKLDITDIQNNFRFETKNISNFAD